MSCKGVKDPSGARQCAAANLICKPIFKPKWRNEPQPYPHSCQPQLAALRVDSKHGESEVRGLYHLVLSGAWDAKERLQREGATALFRISVCNRQIQNNMPRAWYPQTLTPALMQSKPVVSNLGASRRFAVASLEVLGISHLAAAALPNQPLKNVCSRNQQQPFAT